MTKVFISHARKDILFVERLAKDLKGAGLEVWVDLSGLDEGSRVSKDIQNAIQQCQCFVVVLSPNSVESEWTEKEFIYANNLRKKFIPLLLQTCEVPLWLVNLHFIDVQGDAYDRNWWVILKAMGVKPGEPAKAAPSPDAVSLAQSGSIHETGQGAAESSTTGSAAKRIKISPLWLIGLGGLAALLAFGIWGLPAMAARPTPTVTAATVVSPTPKPTFTQTLYPSLPPTLSPALTVALGIGSTWIRPADGMTMVFVPAGTFNMGSEFYAESSPIHAVNLDAYWIDRTDVTNAFYAKCVSAGVCGPPVNFSSATRASYYENPQFDTYPVIWVDWQDASDYCQWVGARLPSEAQWEKAARSPSGKVYPWDPGTWNASPNDNVLNFNSDVGDTTAVDAYPSGASPYGALDMAGNVFQWVNDWFDANYYASFPSSNPAGPSTGTYRVLRGGAWSSSMGHVRSDYRFWHDPAYSDNSIGFRCALPAP